MASSDAVKTLMENLISAEKELETAIAPHLQEWISLRVGIGALGPKNAQRKFRFCGLSKDGLSAFYETEAWFNDDLNDWEFGDEIHFPLAFLDDPTPFYARAAEKMRRFDEKNRQREERNLTREEATPEVLIARLKERRQNLNK